MGLSGPGVIQKGLGMFQNGPVGSGEFSGGFKGSCCLLEGSRDVSELSCGVQEGPGVIQKGWRCPRGVSGRPVCPQGFLESGRGLQWGF